MSKKFVKIIGVLLTLMMAVSAFAGCGSTDQSTTTATTGASTQKASSTATPEAPLKITHFYNYSWADGNYPNTEIGQELQKRCNVKIDLQIAPTDDGQKLNIMVASNELPDMITMEKNDANISKMISGNMIYPVSDLIDQYAPDIRKNVDPEILSLFKQPDGKQYFYPSFVVTKANVEKQKADGMTAVPGGAALTVIRSDVYEAIGKPDMTTPDGFFNALKAIKQKFPKLTPWYFGPYMKENNMFKASELLGSQSPLEWMAGLNVYEANGDMLQSSVRDPKFLEQIKLMNKLYTNKLLDPTSFADSNDVALAKIAKGNYGVMTYNVTSFPDKATIQDNPDAKWVPLPYFTDGKWYKDASGWTATVISKKVSDPARLMKFIEYCTSEEGSQLIAWGVEGKHWNWTDVEGTKLPRYTPELQKILDADWGKFSKQLGCTNYFAFDNFYGHDYPNAKKLSEKSDYEKAVADMVLPNYINDPKLSLLYPAGDSPEGIIQTKLMAIADTYYPKMVMAKDEAAAVSVYNEFMKRCEDTGLAKLEKVWTEKNSQMK